MTGLERRIYEALTRTNERMKQYDADRQAEFDEYMKEAEAQEDAYWKKDYEHKAEWALSFQKHGYEFCETWKNVIADVMFGRIYSEFHSAQAGSRKGKGHGAYVTSELTVDEMNKIEKVFDGLVKHGYLRKSKSGAKAKLVK